MLKRYVRLAHAHPWRCALACAVCASAAALTCVLGSMLTFAPPQAREWVIPRDDVTTWSDAGELASAMLDRYVEARARDIHRALEPWD